MRDIYKHPETGAEVYYCPTKDYEDDNIKIFHFFNSCETESYANLRLDWSPYSTPTKNDLKMWFALGCPTRDSIGDGLGSGNLDTDRLIEALGKQLCIAGF